MRNSSIVYKHAVGNRIIVSDYVIHKFVDKGVRLEPEFFHRERHHLREKGRTRHIGVFAKPRLEPTGNPLSLRHSTDSRRVIHHTLTLSDRELTEQEVTFAWSSSDPIGIAAASVEECRLCGAGGLVCQFDQLVLDFERAQ